MPQLPTSTAEEYGAEDEIKQYTQEEDEGSDDVDVVNDIKDDLLNEDDNAKGDEQLFQPTSSRYGKGDSQGLSYGRPAPVIVGPQHGYYEQSNGYSRTNNSSQAPNPSSYSSSTQIRMPVYPRDERSYSYEHGPWPPQVSVPPHYAMPYGPGIKNYSNYRYPPGVHPGVAYYPPGHGYPGMPGRPVKEPKRPHVKKPLNAFMLFMKEQRPKIAAEFTLKESAAINQILGKRWHALDKSEQAKYYEMARKERAIHMQLYPGWSARDNYAQLGRKKKRPRDKSEEMNPKKCRARYGLDRQEQWCKPCRRKKKCIRFIVGADGETTEVLDKDQVDVNSDSDNDHNGENRSTNIINNNNNTEEVTSAKENIHERVSMATSKENLDTLVNNNNNINILGDSSKLVNSSASSNSSSQFLTKSELRYQHLDHVTRAPESPSSSPSLDSRSSYSSMNCTVAPSRSDNKQSIDTSVLKTISTPCS